MRYKRVIVSRSGEPEVLRVIEEDVPEPGPGEQALEREVLALIKERTQQKIKINWQFSIKTARTKLNSHYERVFAGNVVYKAI